MTTILSDDHRVNKSGSLAYEIPNQPATVHSLLLQKSNEQFELIVWDEQVSGSDAITIDLGTAHKSVKVYDITSGTDPIQTLIDVAAFQLTVSDHAVIVEIDQ